MPDVQMSDLPTKSRPKMSQQATSQIVRARMIRQRLRHPPNAVADAGIDLSHKPAAPAMAPPAAPILSSPAAPILAAPAAPVLASQSPTVAGVLSLDQRINALLTELDQLYARREQHYLRALRHQPTTQTIQRVVARHYGVSVIDLVSARRTQPLAFVRHIAIYLVRELTALSMPSIGRLFGDRDHTTILHAVRKVQARRERDPAFDATLKKLAAAVAPAAAG